jgi:hypothetical protein
MNKVYLYIILALIAFILIGLFLFALYISFTISGGIMEALAKIISGKAFTETNLLQ